MSAIASASREQAGAGLDALTRDETRAAARKLNAAYREKFGFPFLYAVKGSTKHDILNALERRLPSTRDAEHQEALRQVYRIARFRLEELMSLVNRFASGPKRHYYGKGDVIAYRLNRDGKAPAARRCSAPTCCCFCTATRSGKRTPKGTTPASSRPIR